MKTSQFSWSSFFIRLAFASALVFGSYNPSGLSYYHWIIEDFTNISPIMALVGLVLLIGWVIYIRATLRSLGAVGIGLALAFFAVFFWMILDWGLIPTDNFQIITSITEIVLCLVLATGMSWSHIRRRMSGQIDADDVDG